jgi:hypothetical protein
MTEPKAMAKPVCEHVWTWHCGLYLPSVATCMLCGEPNREDVAEQIEDAKWFGLKGRIRRWRRGY